MMMPRVPILIRCLLIYKLTPDGSRIRGRQHRKLWLDDVISPGPDRTGHADRILISCRLFSQIRKLCFNL